MKLLHLQIPQPTSKHSRDIFRFPDAHERRSLFPRDPCAKLERREQSGSLGRPDARGTKQLGGGSLGQPPERSVGNSQQPPGHLEDVASPSSRTYQDGKKFGGRQRRCPKRPEALPRPIAFGKRGNLNVHARTWREKQNDVVALSGGTGLNLRRQLTKCLRRPRVPPRTSLHL